jgi:hypothetical protein
VSMDGLAPANRVIAALGSNSVHSSAPKLSNDPNAGSSVTVGASVSHAPDSVLLLSQRRLADLVAFCLVYEFEDVLGAVTGAKRLEAVDLPALEFSRRAYKLARLAFGSPKLARKLAPYPSSNIVLDRDYDLFFPMFSHTHELYALAMIPNWRQRCRKAACFITEVWSDKLPEYLVEQMSNFDHIFIGFSHSVEEVARLTGRPCSYLPLASDVLRFAPASSEDPRPIDVCNIGRRSSVTHQALLEQAQKNGIFYYYDTVAASGSDRKQRTFKVDVPHEHRLMLAALLKRSRYYFANRSLINQPDVTGGREEISARFYEGAAAGTVMIGEAPRTDQFRQQFDWVDSVIHVPFDSPDIGQILKDLDAEPQRIANIRRNNVRQAALRHDWLHRIEVAFKTLGFAPTAAMQERAQRLKHIAAQT